MLRDQLLRRDVEKIAIACRRQAEARRDRGDAVRDILRRLHQLRLGLARRRQITQVRRKFRVGMAQKDDGKGLRVRELSLELERAEEVRLLL